MLKIKYFISLAIFLLTFTVLFGQKTIDKTIKHGGLTRSYRLYIPKKYDGSKAVPLLFNLHGFTSNNVQQEFYGDFRPISDTAGFIICHPLGTTTNTGQTFWNVGFFPSPIDDIGFITSLIDTISTTYKINQKKVFSTGMSNGGFMSYYLACSTSRFAAVASVTGSFTDLMYKTCKPTHPTPIMEIHGTADGTVPYNGMTNFQPIDTVLKFWVKYNNCNPAVVNNVPENPAFPNDGASAVHYVFSGGKNGSTVEHFKIVNGAHTWPGAGITIGVTCMDISASKEIWRFFSKYSLTTAVENVESDILFSLYPNPADDNLLIKTDGNENYGIEIIDLQGKIVLKSATNNEQKTLDIQALPKGLYVARLISAKGQLNRKFVKN